MVEGGRGVSKRELGAIRRVIVSVANRVDTSDPAYAVATALESVRRRRDNDAQRAAYRFRTGFRTIALTDAENATLDRVAA